MDALANPGYPHIYDALVDDYLLDDPLSLYDAYIGVVLKKDIPCDGSCRSETCPYNTAQNLDMRYSPFPPVIQTDRHPVVSAQPYIHDPVATEIDNVSLFSELSPPSHSQVPESRTMSNAAYWQQPPPRQQAYYTDKYAVTSYPIMDTVSTSYYDPRSYESLHRNYIANTSTRGTTAAPIETTQLAPRTNTTKVVVGYYYKPPRKTGMNYIVQNPKETDMAKVEETTRAAQTEGNGGGEMICSFHMDFIPKLEDLKKYLRGFGELTNKVEIEWDCHYGGGPNIDGPVKGVPIAKIRFKLASSARSVCDKSRTHTIQSGIKFRAYKSMKQYVNSYNKNNKKNSKKKKQKK